MMDIFDLTGKVALITGSSRGIGRATAEMMAAQGAKVVISSRKQDACDAVAAEINAQHGKGTAIACCANIASKEALQALVDQTRASFGRIDTLVCNAATNPYYGPMAGITDEQFRKILDNNILSVHWLAQMVAPEMMERKQGSIIVISSMGGVFGSANLGAYAISKAADLQFVRNLAVELGSYNIKVNAIAPGVIYTDFATYLLKAPELEASLRDDTPLGRIGEPKDVAGAAVFFASEAAGHITGQYIAVDGGMHVKGRV